MRVLVWAELFWPLVGGVEVRLGHLLTKLKQEGHECAVITNRVAQAPLPFEEWKGIPIRRFDFRHAFLERDLRRLGRLRAEALQVKQAFGPDVEHVICTGPSIVVQQMCHRIDPRPVVATLHCDHEDLFRKHANDVLRTMFCQAQVVIALSPLMRQGLLARFPELRDRLELVASELPWPDVEPTQLPSDPPVLLCLGRLVRDKGFDLALQALAVLAPKYPHLKMLVAGDGVERGSLEALARKLGIGFKVEFLGQVESELVPLLLNRATVVLVASRNEEPSAVVLREAAQMGRAIVATRVGGTPELIEDGVNGLLVEKENPGAIADAVRRLLDHPEELRVLGGNARARAKQQFDFQRYFDHIMRLYRVAQNRFQAGGKSTS